MKFPEHWVMKALERNNFQFKDASDYLLSHSRELKIEDRQEDMAIAFASMDADKSGSVSYDEFLKKIYKMKDSDAQFLLEQVKYNILSVRDVIMNTLLAQQEQLLALEHAEKNALDKIVETENQVVQGVQQIETQAAEISSPLGAQTLKQKKATDEAKDGAEFKLQGVAEQSFIKVDDDYFVQAASVGKLPFEGPCMFNDRAQVADGLRETMMSRKMTHPVTIRFFKEMGIDFFWWLGPKERVGVEDGSKWPNGAFVYLYRDDDEEMDCFLPIP